MSGLSDNQRSGSEKCQTLPWPRTTPWLGTTSSWGRSVRRQHLPDSCSSRYRSISNRFSKFPQLPGRAAGTLGILVSSLVVSGFGLAPGQTNRALGIEIAAAGAIVAVQALWVTHGKETPNEPRAWVVEHLATLLLPSIALIAGGVSLAAGKGGGLYWVLAGILFAFVSASINGWVLLVEIKR